MALSCRLKRGHGWSFSGEFCREARGLETKNRQVQLKYENMISNNLHTVCDNVTTVIDRHRLAIYRGKGCRGLQSLIKHSS